ncbi:MAG: IMPACT family protein [Pseudomarimonas sp.]
MIESASCDRFTLSAPWRHSAEINRSRFHAIAEPLGDLDSWEARLADLSDPSASHACWAWKFDQHYRSADAGEPAGSAGRPILAAINGQQLDRVLVVVLRWFGGIKLGVGGLVRAYGGTAAECLRCAPRVALVEQVLGELHCGFEHADAVHRLLAAHHASITESTFTSAGVQLHIRVPCAALPELQHSLAGATRGRARLVPAPDCSQR